MSWFYATDPVSFQILYPSYGRITLERQYDYRNFVFGKIDTEFRFRAAQAKRDRV